MGANIIKQECPLSGSFKPNVSLTGLIEANGTLKGALSLPVGYKDYTGEYEVTPATVPQVLETADKRMNSDVTVKEIPYYEVSNPQNGKTIIIGG